MAARAAISGAISGASTSSSLASSLSRVFSLVSFVSLAVLRNRAFASGLSYGKEPVPVAHAETGEVGHELGAGNCVPTSEARRRKPRDVAGRGFNV
tara:strand:- start:113 stop:400 length:288 start_codon:yes stop_codon:yes gene_type:complete